MKKSLYTVYSQRLAGYLMLNGFPLLKITPDSRTGKNNFLFANNEMMQDYIDRWQLEKMQNNKRMQ